MASALQRPLSRAPNRFFHTENVDMSAEILFVRPMRMDVKKVRPPNYCSSRRISSWIGSIQVMLVDAVPIVKVEHLKELLPAQRPSCLATCTSGYMYPLVVRLVWRLVKAMGVY